MPSVERILQLAPAASYLAARYVDKKSFLNGGALVPKQSINIYRIYKILKHVYDKDNNYPGLQERCNYLYELLKRWSITAAAIVDGNNGGVVVPITPVKIFWEYLIDVNGGVPPFANATDYNDTRIVGHNLDIFWNDIPRFLVAGEWAYTPTGIRILVAGFDATANVYDFRIFIKDPLGTLVTGEVPRQFQYTATGGETSIFNTILVNTNIVAVFRGTPYNIINSGTPTGLDALVTLNGSSLSDGHITFASDNPLVGPPNPEIVTIIFSVGGSGVSDSSDTFRITE